MITVIRPGLLTTVQDLGRNGLQKYGVSVTGAMDSIALKIANILVGNLENAAGLEITLMGPTLRIERNMLVSLCGANLAPTIDGEGMPMWRPVFVEQGSVMEFGRPVYGCRAYLAAAGGFDVPVVMGSRSTYLRAGIGGHHGRRLQSGDQLEVLPPSDVSMDFVRRVTAVPNCVSALQKAGQGDDAPKASSFYTTRWCVDSDSIVFYRKHPFIRIMEGPEFALFSLDARRSLFNHEFRVSVHSDRMGYRMEGPRLLLSNDGDMLSEAVVAGTVQVPPDGNPIILMADRQTVGGYPRIAQVAAVDLPVLAQIKPGQTIRFRKISVEDAQRLYVDQVRAIQRLRKSITLRVRNG